MNRRIFVFGLAFTILLLAAALSLCQTAQRAPAPVPRDAGVRAAAPAIGMVTVTAVDVEQRRLTITALGRRPSPIPATLPVAPDAEIYRPSNVALADLSPGDVVDARVFSRSADITVGGQGAPFPPHTFAATAEVVALQPLTLRAHPGISITIRDTSSLTLRRWERITLADIAEGDRISAIAQPTEGEATAGWIQVWGRPRPSGSSFL